MSDYQRSIQLKFRFLAAFYDLFDLVFLAAPTRNPRKALAARIPDGGLRILDVCIGTANSALEMAGRGDRHRIAGVDLSPAMLSVAQRKIRRRQVGNIDLAEMDATRLGFPDGAFDIAAISFALHELEFPLMMGILHEMSRVLKPGGNLYIVDYEQPRPLLLRRLFDVFLALIEPRHIWRFLQYDWDAILREAGCAMESSDPYLFSRLIAACKIPGARTV